MNEEETAKKGPKADRFLMRLKDAIIIGTAGIALIKWFYVNPVQIQERVARQQETLETIAKNAEVTNRTLTTTNEQLAVLTKEFTAFRHSFYARKPGGWTYEDDRWKWDASDKARSQ